MGEGAQLSTQAPSGQLHHVSLEIGLFPLLVPSAAFMCARCHRIRVGAEDSGMMTSLVGGTCSEPEAQVQAWLCLSGACEVVESFVLSIPAPHLENGGNHSSPEGLRGPVPQRSKAFGTVAGTEWAPLEFES